MIDFAARPRYYLCTPPVAATAAETKLKMATANETPRYETYAKQYLATAEHRLGAIVQNGKEVAPARYDKNGLRASAIMSILSDAQEATDRGRVVYANELMNAAKYLAADIQDDTRVGG